MTDVNDLRELQSRVESAESSLRLIQEQQKDAGNLVKSRLAHTLQAVRQHQQEFEQAKRLARHYQSEAAQLKSMLHRLLECIDAVQSDGSKSLAEEFEAELASLAEVSKVGATAEKQSESPYPEPRVRESEGDLDLTEKPEGPAFRKEDALRKVGIRPSRPDQPDSSDKPDIDANRPRPFRTGRV